MMAETSSNATSGSTVPASTRAMVDKILKEQFANVIKVSDQEIKEFKVTSKPSDEFMGYLKLKEFHEVYGTEQSNDYVELDKAMRSSLCLKELQKPENAALYDKLMTESATAASGTINLKTALLNNDEAAQEQLKLIDALSKLLSGSQDYAKIKGDIDKKIADCDVVKDLSAAGYSKPTIDGIVGNQQAHDSLKLAKVFHEEVEMDGATLKEKAQTFIAALKDNRRGVVAVLTSPHTKLALASVGFAMACASGGILPLAVSTPRLMSAVAKNSKIQEIGAKYTAKIAAVTQKLGINIKPALGLMAKARDMLAKVADSKAFKYGTLGLGAVGIAGGLALLSDSTLHTHILDGLSNVRDLSDGSGMLPTAPSYHDMVVNKGDSLWKMVGDQFQTMEGHKASAQQITKIISDMGITDPNHIAAGTHIKMPVDFSQYDGATKVANADWLQDPSNHVTAVDHTIVMGHGIPDKLNMADFYDQFKHTHPGEPLPSVKDAIAQVSFGEGKPAYLDMDKFYDLVVQQNPGITDHFNGVVDLNHLDHFPRGAWNGDFTISGKSEMVNLRHTILDKAFNGHVPSTLDTNQFMKDVEAANPGLRSAMLHGTDSIHIKLPADMIEQPIISHTVTVVHQGVTGSEINKDIAAKYLEKNQSLSNDM